MIRSSFSMALGLNKGVTIITNDGSTILTPSRSANLFRKYSNYLFVDKYQTNQLFYTEL